MLCCGTDQPVKQRKSLHAYCNCVELVVSHAAQKVSWEEQVPQVALRQEAVLIADEHPAFAMRWASMQEFWKVLYTPLLDMRPFDAFCMSLRCTYRPF